MFVVLASRKAFVFEFRVPKIEEQANFDSGGVQIIDDLGLVLRGNNFYRFELHDHLLPPRIYPHKNHPHILP